MQTCNENRTVESQELNQELRDLNKFLKKEENKQKDLNELREDIERIQGIDDQKFEDYGDKKIHLERGGEPAGNQVLHGFVEVACAGMKAHEFLSGNPVLSKPPVE